MMHRHNRHLTMAADPGTYMAEQHRFPGERTLAGLP